MQPHQLHRFKAGPGSRNVFTGSLARSDQELWLVKVLTATTVASAGVKGVNLVQHAEEQLEKR